MRSPTSGNLSSERFYFGKFGNIKGNMGMKAINSSIAAAVILVAATVSSQAQEPTRGGAARLLDWGQHITTRAEAEQLKAGDSINMICTKCKSVAVTHVTSERGGHIKTMTPGEKHLCPGCKSIIKVVGVGRGAKDEVKHVCEKCGEDSVFCCATKAGSGPTEGMQKK
jgi:hypothetical protein